jgi:hypothetical protein
LRNVISIEFIACRARFVAETGFARDNSGQDFAAPTKLRDSETANRCHRVMTIYAKEGSAMKPLALISGAALLATAAAGIALAQGGPGLGHPGPEADVTRQQVIERTDQRFARLDANHDGRVTPDEVRSTGEHRRDEMRQHMFDRLDANHDGNISREEFAQAHAMHDGPGGPGGHRGRHMGPPPGGPGGPEGAGHGMRGARMFGDQGFVTLEQMRARALERFDRADANHDGTLTAAERRAAHGRMRDGPDEPRPS